MEHAMLQSQGLHRLQMALIVGLPVQERCLGAWPLCVRVPDTVATLFQMEQQFLSHWLLPEHIQCARCEVIFSYQITIQTFGGFPRTPGTEGDHDIFLYLQ